jgi:hypothetical protein
MKEQAVKKMKCINGSYVHIFEAFFDEKMNVTERCKNCGMAYFHNVSDSYEDIVKNEKTKE